MAEYINFRDKSQPLRKRKVAFFEWLIERKGYSIAEAKAMTRHYADLHRGE